MIDPFARFGALLERAKNSELGEPTAMALATATGDGRPSVRMVLLKSFDQRGFVFFTNLESRKAGELTENPWASLCFYWEPLDAQVRVEGSVSLIARDEADEYFQTRARTSQVGAWASLQSRPLGSYAELDDRVAEIENRFQGVPVPRPDFWSGFRLAPSRIEFWSGKPGRLHEREVFVRETEDGEWRAHLLYP